MNPKSFLPSVVTIGFLCILLTQCVGNAGRDISWMDSVSDSYLLAKLMADSKSPEILGVILGARLESIDRIISRQSLPTPQFSARIRDVAATYYSSGKKWRKLCESYIPTDLRKTDIRGNAFEPKRSRMLYLEVVIYIILFILICRYGSDMSMLLIIAIIIDAVIKFPYRKEILDNERFLVENYHYQHENEVEIPLPLNE